MEPLFGSLAGFVGMVLGIAVVIGAWRGARTTIARKFLFSFCLALCVYLSIGLAGVVMTPPQALWITQTSLLLGTAGLVFWGHRRVLHLSQARARVR